jgi:hypothetical protein
MYENLVNNTLLSTVVAADSKKTMKDQKVTEVIRIPNSLAPFDVRRPHARSATTKATKVVARKSKE